MSWFRRFFGLPPKPDVPDVGLTPREIDINIQPRGQAALRRHAARLSRILRTLRTDELNDEIAMRQRALKLAGFKPPSTPAEADQILKQLEIADGYHT